MSCLFSVAAVGCGSSGEAADTGNGGGEGGTGGTSEDPVCTKGVYWQGGDHGAPEMHPGRACVTCHQEDPKGEAPLLRFGGTVYTTKHEPDECNGGSTNASDYLWVEITDATGFQLNLPVNNAGNFYYFEATSAIAMPYTARVLKNGIDRVMGTAQTSGDCNGCHTQDGANGAPGRIWMP